MLLVGEPVTDEGALAEGAALALELGLAAGDELALGVLLVGVPLGTGVGEPSPDGVGLGALGDAVGVGAALGDGVSLGDGPGTADSVGGGEDSGDSEGDSGSAAGPDAESDGDSDGACDADADADSEGCEPGTTFAPTFPPDWATAAEPSPRECRGSPCDPPSLAR